MNADVRADVLLLAIESLPREELRKALLFEYGPTLAVNILANCKSDVIDLFLKNQIAYPLHHSEVNKLVGNPNLTDSQFLNLVRHVDKKSWQIIGPRTKEIKDRSILEKVLEYEPIQSFACFNPILEDSYGENFLEQISTRTGVQSQVLVNSIYNSLPRFKNKIVDLLCSHQSFLYRFCAVLEYFDAKFDLNCFSENDIRKIIDHEQNKTIEPEKDTHFLKIAYLFDQASANILKEAWSNISDEAHCIQVFLDHKNCSLELCTYMFITLIEKISPELKIFLSNKYLSILPKTKVFSKFTEELKEFIADELTKSRMFSSQDRSNLITLFGSEELVDSYIAAEKLSD